MQKELKKVTGIRKGEKWKGQGNGSGRRIHIYIDATDCDRKWSVVYRNLDFTTTMYPGVNRDHYCNAAVLLPRTCYCCSKDTQQDRVTTKAVAAATSSVCLKIHSGKLISLEVRVLMMQDISPVQNTNWSILDRPLIATCSQKATTAVIHFTTTQAPCAVCYVGGRSTVLVVPARTQCPDGWTTEYAGYLVSESGDHSYRSSYVCWDEAPEVALGGTSQNHALIYPVEVLCGSLPCSAYPTGRELTCIVCSK